MTGWVNTLMAGTANARVKRYKYTAAGYVSGEGMPELYVSREPAGSAAENLRDLNLPGYRTERPWNDTPDPFFGAEIAAQPVSNPVRRTRRNTKHRGDWVEWLYREAKRAKRDVAACVIFGAVILTLTALWGQKMVEGVQLQSGIASYQAQTNALEKDNERLSQQIEQAKSGERIRNLAQNELGMLRPERAETKTIYIETPVSSAEGVLEKNEKPSFEVLDFALGILEMLE